MAATELLAIANTAANSADFTVAASGSRILYVKGTGEIALQLKDGANYYTVDTLHGGKAAVVIQGGAEIMTYRVSRDAGEYAGASYI